MASLALLFSVTNTLLWVLTVIHVIICLLLIVVVLLQQRRGQDLASAFGGGPSQANVAALSAEDFITKATKYGAFVFMGTSLVLARFPPGASHGEVERLLQEESGSPSVSGTEDPAAESAPATDASLPAPVESVPPSESAPLESVAPAETAPAEAPAGETGP